MLRNIRIRNFRSCKDVRLENCPGLVALVGKNGAGKTNILRAIEWVSRVVADTDPSDWPYFRQDAWPTSVEFEVTLPEHVYRYGYTTDVRTASASQIVEIREYLEIEQDGGRWELVFERRNETVQFATNAQLLKIAAHSNALSAIIALLPAGDELAKLVRPLHVYLSGIRYYSYDERTDLPRLSSESQTGVVSGAQYVKWVADSTSAKSANGLVALQLLHMWREEREKWEELLQLLGPHGLGVINHIAVQQIAVDQSSVSKRIDQQIFLVRFMPGGRGVSDQRLFAFAELSYGTRRLLRIIVSLLQNPGTVMLLEQPEDGIHPGLTRKLAGLLRSYSDRLQLIIATHSSNVFNKLRPEELRLVFMSHGETHVRALSDVEVSAAKVFMEQEGSLSDFVATVEEE